MNNNHGSYFSHKWREERGASQGVLLGILALLLALFAYLYFFTGLIIERGVKPSPLPPPVQKVKQAIPPRPAGYDNRSGVSAPQQVKATAPAAPAAGQVAPQPPSAAPVTASAKPQPTPPPAVAVKATVPAPKPAPEQEKSKSQPPQVAAKPATVQQTKPVAKVAEPEKKGAKAEEPKPVPVKSAGKRYRITVSTISAQDKVTAVLAEMKKSGLQKIEKSEQAEEKTMKRLFVDDFADSQSAYSELDKVKRVASGAFLVIESGKYALYAGSYDQEARAAEELKRLSGQGMNVTLKKSRVKIPVIRITAMATDKKKGEGALRNLKKLGVAADMRQDAK